MAPKKKGTTMSLTAFRGDSNVNQLPTKSEGKEQVKGDKGRGKGGKFGGDDRTRGDNDDWRGGGAFRGGGGGGRRDDHASDNRDWRSEGMSRGGGDRFSNQNRFARSGNDDGFPGSGDSRPDHLRLKSRLQKKGGEAPSGRIDENEVLDDDNNSPKDQKAKKPARTQEPSEKPQKRHERKKEIEEVKVVEIPCDAAKLKEFDSFVEKSLANEQDRVKLILHLNFDDEEYASRAILETLFRRVMQFSLGMTEEQVIDLYRSYSAIISTLVEKSETRRFKIQLLYAVQTVSVEMKFPRLSPAMSLVEATFDALYFSELVEEQYFHWWSEDEQEIQGKTQALFQSSAWFTWIREARIEGEETEDEDEDSDEDSDQEDED